MKKATILLQLLGTLIYMSDAVRHGVEKESIRSVSQQFVSSSTVDTDATQFSLAQISVLLDRRLRKKNASRRSNTHGRSLTASFDFVTTCTELRIIFHDQCTCAQVSLAVSNQITCDFNGMNAVAYFNQFDLTLSSLQVCKDQACISIFYSQETALFCEAISALGATCDCLLCDPFPGTRANYTVASGLLGLNVSCPDNSLTTNGCEVASSVLDLGDWKAPLSPGEKAAISMGTLLVAAVLGGVLGYFLYQRRQRRDAQTMKEARSANPFSDDYSVQSQNSRTPIGLYEDGSRQPKKSRMESSSLD